MTTITLPNLTIKPAPGLLAHKNRSTKKPYLEHVLFCETCTSMDGQRSWIDIPIWLCHIDSITSSDDSSTKLRSLMRDGKTVNITLYIDFEENSDE